MTHHPFRGKSLNQILTKIRSITTKEYFTHNLNRVMNIVIIITK